MECGCIRLPLLFFQKHLPARSAKRCYYLYWFLGDFNEPDTNGIHVKIAVISA